VQRLIYFDEREMLLIEWARERGMKRQTLARRLNSGWGIEKALTHPVRDSINMDAAAARITGEKFYNSVPCLKCGCGIRSTKKGYCPVCKRNKAKADYNEQRKEIDSCSDNT